MTPGTRVDILPWRVRSGTVTAIHKCGILVLLDDGGHLYYDRLRLAEIESPAYEEEYTI